MSPIAQKALAIAASQVGIREATGRNDGPEVEKYLASVRLGSGYPWCQAAVHWCYSEAVKGTNWKNQVPKTGGVLKHWNLSSCKKFSSPEPGDLFVMEFKGGTGHIGFIEKVSGEFIHTIEGNTNIEGSREGIGWFRRRRKISSINKGFISY
jgi:hypothetical protein